MRHSETNLKRAIQGLASLNRSVIPPLLVVLLLGACSSSQVDKEDRESERRKAAESNTSLGLEYMDRGQYEVAFGKLKKAIAEDPDYAPGHTVLAVLYERLGENEMAGKHYKKAYEVDPKDGDVNNNYGIYLCKTGKTGEAVDHFRTALEDPFYNSPEVALTNAGSCELGAGNIPEADDFLRQALKIDPAFPDALLSMSRLNYRENSYLRARAFIQRYESSASHTASSLLLAFKIELALHDKRAQGKYMQALETNFSESEQAAEARRLSGK
jgi:type IV pilus assembly protein PilF